MDSKWKIIMILIRLSHMIESQLETLLDPFGVGLTDLRLLTIISLLKGSSQKTLARKMGLSQVVISTRLDKLERMGLIAREQVLGRLVAVELTPNGHQFLGTLINVIEVSAPALALDRLTDTAEAKVVDSLELLVQLMHEFSIEPLHGNPIPVGRPEGPASSIRRRLENARIALDQTLSEQNYRMTEAVQRLTEEIDTLLEAYMLLRKSDTRRGL